MPGMDGKGPAGQGPMTGRGLGPCGRGLARGRAPARGLGLGRGWGRGLGFGLGLALGWCRRAAWWAGTPAEEREVLKARQEVLERQLELVKQQLAETETKEEQA